MARHTLGRQTVVQLPQSGGPTRRDPIHYPVHLLYVEAAISTKEHQSGQIRL